jgi:hypothetical protein
MADAEADAVMHAEAYAAGVSTHTQSPHMRAFGVCLCLCLCGDGGGGGGRHNMHKCILFKMPERRRRCACGRVGVCGGGHAWGGRGGR